MTTKTLTRDHAAAASLAGVLAAVGAALVLLWFAGFAEASAFHDSAHDTRHTLAFPCH